MAPSFLKDLRRRSKASFRTDRSTDSSSRSDGTVPTTKSSSTLNSSYGSQTPPSAIVTSQSSPSLQSQGNLPAANRPQIQISSPKRQSVNGMSGLGSPITNGISTLPISPYAPRILSISDGAWVNQKVLSIYGIISEPASQTIDGNLTVSRLDDDIPPTYWPVCESHFKALVYLNPGPNKLRFDFSSPKLANNNTTNPIHSSYLTINMMPMTNSPPLQLVILLGKDSPGTFDAVPARIEHEGNGLEIAIKKFRMAAYLWQAFTAEQMWRNRMGRRCFRFEEEWQTGTSNYRDRGLGTMRSEAKINIVRSSKTVAELRDLQIAQQFDKATRKDDLFNIALEDVKKYFKPLSWQKQYVSVLLLDSHWDTKIKTVRAHAALGGGDDQIQIAIFGSHALQSYPSSIEEVVPAFTDCTRTDMNYVANDAMESGSSWEAANVGIGAHLHEIGHLFGCPHRESGIMLRDYVNLNRSFTIREPFSTRTNAKGGLVLPKDECAWHRLDCLRFRNHPCFRLPNDARAAPDESIQVWPVGNGNLLVTAASGVSYVEIFTEGEELCRTWIEYGDGNGGGPLQRQVVLTEQDLRSRLPEDRKLRKLKLFLNSFGGGGYEIEDFVQLVSKVSAIKLSNGQMAYRGDKVGVSGMDGTEKQEVIFDSVSQQTKVIKQVKIYHNLLAVHGLEFLYEDATSQLFGKRGAEGSEFNIDIRRGEYILGFNVRGGFYVDAVQVLTSNGRKSEMFGNENGGVFSTLIPPRGYSIAGLTGSCAQFIDGFGIIITR